MFNTLMTIGCFVGLAGLLAVIGYGTRSMWREMRKMDADREAEPRDWEEE